MAGVAPVPKFSGGLWRVFLWFIGLILIPLALLGAAESVLRGLSYGYPTAYFQRDEANGLPIYHENLFFFRRFFPSPDVVREAAPIEVPVCKTPGTCRIFVFGGSAAMGEPDIAFGFWRILEVMLEDQFPGMRFEVLNTATASINSHAILPVARSCARLEPDFFVVFAGNNEVVGPFGAGTIWQPYSPSLFLIRTSLWARKWRIGQLIDDLVTRMRAGDGPSHERPSMSLFLDHQVRFDEPRLDRVYTHFARNLSDILAAGHKAGAAVILLTVPVNLRDFAPFGSSHRPSLSQDEEAAWDMCFSAALEAEAAGEHALAADSYRQAAAIDDTYAELCYRLGRCCLLLGDAEQAQAFLRRACDMDTLRFRADSRINRVIRETAERWRTRGVYLADVEHALAEESGQGLPGDEWFFEHVHMRFEGNYRVAREVFDQVVPLLPESIRRRTAAPPRETCAERLALTPLVLRLHHEYMRGLQEGEIFTAQFNYRERRDALQRQIVALPLDSATLEKSVAMGRAALERDPDDYYLPIRHTQALIESGKTEEAVAARRAHVGRYPYRFASYVDLGYALARNGQWDEAIEDYRKALTMYPSGLPYIFLELGLALEKKGDLEGAAREYRHCLEQDPHNSLAHNNLGFLLMKQGETEAALAQYREALRENPELLLACENLDNYYLSRGDARGRTHEWQKLVKQSPESARLNYFLGLALHAQGDPAQAVDAFQHAVQADPCLAEGHFELGWALHRLGRIEEALGAYDRALNLDAEYALAWNNKGFALYGLGRYREALECYRRALDADPDLELARENRAILLRAAPHLEP